MSHEEKRHGVPTTVSVRKKGGGSHTDKSRPINLTSGVQSFKTDLEEKKFLYTKQEKKIKKLQTLNMVCKYGTLICWKSDIL